MNADTSPIVDAQTQSGIQLHRLTRIRERLEPGMRESDALALLVEGSIQRGVEYPLIWYREDEEWGAYDGVFEENMVVCIECYVGELGGHGGVKLEQPVWLGADGVVLLSEYPLELDYL